MWISSLKDIHIGEFIFEALLISRHTTAREGKCGYHYLEHPLPVS